MTQEGKGLHETGAELGADVIDRHRATTSLIEELEAVDWYDQRAKATHDPELQALLEHNRDEEMEHAAMLLEWLRRKHPHLDEQLRTYLFKEGSIVGREEGEQGGSGGGGRSDGSLGIGSLRAGGEAE